MTPPNRNRDNVFHERASVLEKQGYCGFKIAGIENKWDQIRVTAVNSAGRSATGSGETREEAYQNLIETIDYMLE